MKSRLQVPAINGFDRYNNISSSRTQLRCAKTRHAFHSTYYVGPTVVGQVCGF